jgi:HEAT repeat protein
MGKPELIELLHLLATGPEEGREAAALALGQLGSMAIEPLAAMLAEDSADVRWWAARALAQVHQDATVPALVQGLEDPDADVRACCALALGRMGSGLGPSSQQDAARALAAHLSDESAFVAGIAGDALSMLGEAATEALADTLHAPSAHARLLAVRALARTKAQAAIGPLFEALDDPSYLVRYYAQEALEMMGVGMVYLSP